MQDIKSFQLKLFKDDLFAAFSVALLTIPQSIAYSLLAGLPPSAGLFSAVFGSIFVGVFGSSKHLIAGPTTAVAILIQTTISEVLYNFYPNLTGTDKDVYTLALLSYIVFVIGILQIVFGLFNMGKILQFVSRSVILGYFFGVIIAIVINQLFPFFGLPSPKGTGASIYRLWDLFLEVKNISLVTTSLGLFGIFYLLFAKKKFPRMPNALIMLIFISVIAYFINDYLIKMTPLVTKSHLQIAFLQDAGVDRFPKISFNIPFFSLEILNEIFPSALAISMLGILEVFSVSRTVASASGQLINSSQEIFSFGVSNTFLSFLYGAMPASGSISRSLFNYKSRAKTRFSAVFSGVFVALLIALFWSFVKHIPLVALSSILIAMAPTFIDYRQIKLSLTVTREDKTVFLLTILSTLIFSLHIALFIGIAISIATYLRRAAVPHVVEYAFNSAGRLVIVGAKKIVRRKVRIIGIAGELFFGSVDLFQSTFQKISKDPFVKVIVLRLNNVYHIDASMCQALLNLNDTLAKVNKSLIISGITSEIWQVFSRAGLVKLIGESNLFLTDETNPQLSTWNACMRAKDLIGEEEI